MTTLHYKNKMPKALLKKWLKALRSGEYKKGRGALYRPEKDGKDPSFCCLGVLQHCITGGVEYDGDDARGLPSLEWLAEHDIHFRNNHENGDYESQNPSFQMGNGVVRSASSINDSVSHNYTFAKIADYIEKSFIGT